METAVSHGSKDLLEHEHFSGGSRSSSGGRRGRSRMRARWGPPRLGPGRTRSPSSSSSPLPNPGALLRRSATPPPPPPHKLLAARGSRSWRFAPPCCGQKEWGPLSLRTRVKKFQGRWKSAWCGSHARPCVSLSKGQRHSVSRADRRRRLSLSEGVTGEAAGGGDMAVRVTTGNQELLWSGS